VTKTLVTGATGFVGSHVLRALVRNGSPTRILARPTSEIGSLSDCNSEVCYGDLRDLESLQRAVEGVHVVFHCAGEVSDWGDPARFRQTNVAGLQNLILACRHGGVPRLVVMSSLSVYGIKRHDGTVETAPLCRTGDNYSDSKIEAEKRLAQEMESTGPAITILRPGFIYGPGDRKFIPKLLSAITSGRFAFIGDGENVLNIVHIDDVVRCTLLAAVSPVAANRSYNITDGTRTTARDFVRELARISDLPEPKRHVPYAAAYLLCRVSELVARATGRPPRISRAALKVLGVSRFFDISRARHELGYQPSVFYREGLKSVLPL
jgi:nucleoside-diphosphate-sugar epimerase